MLFDEFAFFLSPQELMVATVSLPFQTDTVDPHLEHWRLTPIASQY
jgi:hypothetical protein